MGIVDSVKRLIGRGGTSDADDGMDAAEIARRTRGEEEPAIESVQADLERERADADKRVTDVDGDD